ncbi:hypothetical protein KIN20_013611 [Parelaphostrongylus tenuis]|uniref:Uncharacterized protein n=1 Tax=Parelaphostrongylus tenuis TaxID=148309 RepID=A0AAD5QNX0_PARTN|nr:hypothetical protein KIN20_013611 [Parelaphostrongylus tenuis]
MDNEDRGWIEGAHARKKIYVKSSLLGRYRYLFEKYQSSRYDVQLTQRNEKNYWVTYKQEENTVRGISGKKIKHIDLPYVYIGHSMIMENNMKEELDRRKAAWAELKLLSGGTGQTTIINSVLIFSTQQSSQCCVMQQRRVLIPQ